MPPITLRVRTQLGVWRLQNVNSNDTIADLRSRIETEHNTELLSKPIAADPSGKDFNLKLNKTKSPPTFSPFGNEVILAQPSNLKSPPTFKPFGSEVIFEYAKFKSPLTFNPSGNDSIWDLAKFRSPQTLNPSGNDLTFE